MCPVYLCGQAKLSLHHRWPLIRGMGILMQEFRPLGFDAVVSTLVQHWPLVHVKSCGNRSAYYFMTIIKSYVYS